MNPACFQGVSVVAMDSEIRESNMTINGNLAPEHKATLPTVINRIQELGGRSTIFNNIRINVHDGGKPSGSGLPVPRFVSLKAKEVNVRVGPGEDYPVAWKFLKSRLPVEVTQESDNWRRIRDSDGSEGWIFQSLLSGERTAVVAPWQKGNPLPLYTNSSSDAGIAAYLQPGVLADVDECEDGWCRLSGGNFRGWIRQDRLWGVYPDERVD